MIRVASIAIHQMPWMSSSKLNSAQISRFWLLVEVIESSKESAKNHKKTKQATFSEDTNLKYLLYKALDIFISSVINTSTAILHSLQLSIANSPRCLLLFGRPIIFCSWTTSLWRLHQDKTQFYTVKTVTMDPRQRLHAVSSDVLDQLASSFSDHLRWLNGHLEGVRIDAAKRRSAREEQVDG